MTAIAEPPSDSHWQTLAGRAFLLVLTALIGRWVAGATFGYLLFAAAWGPVAVILLIDGRSLKRAFIATASVAILIASPLIFGWPSRTALSLALLLSLLNATAGGGALLAIRFLSDTIGRAVTILLWLT
ncbi:MAG: hypothetical protein JWM57_737, partial [Phycisphaerales bacterium]|nr:hypothetical protein [Phycisphaerales bacterium]